MKITKRMSQSPLIQFCNFKDGSFVNLVKMEKPYADGRSYYVHETTKSIFCSSGFFTNYEAAKAKFDLMCKNAKECGYVVSSEGLTGNI